MEIWQVQLIGPMQTPDSPSEYFTQFSFIETSLRVSYSACKSVDITKSPKPHGGPTFTVTGMIAHEIDKDEPFQHVYQTKRLSVHDRPTHF